MTGRAVLVLAALAAATLTATGCSSSGSGSPAGGAITSPPAGTSSIAGPTSSGSTSSGSTSSGPTAAGSATCRQLTAADVQPLVVDKIVKVDVSVPPELGPAAQLCLFDAVDATGSLSVEVAGGQLATTLYAADVASATKPVSLPGVGDKAMRDAGAESAAVSAFHGGEYCRVDTNAAGSVPGTDRLYVENGHHTNIGDPAFAIVAAAFGTVCNQIFGSGSTTPDLSGLAALHAAPPSDAGLPTDFHLPTDGPTS